MGADVETAKSSTVSFAGLFGDRKIETAISLRSEPVGASIRMISRWNKLVCDGRKINALDFEACEGWIELAAGSTVHALGDYHYYAVWPDGTSKSGRLSLNKPLRTSEVIVTAAGPVIR